MTQTIPMNLLYDKEYLAAKTRLEAQGYSPVLQENGLIPYLFYDKVQTVYLFRPALDGRSVYREEWVAGNNLQPADFSNPNRPVLRIPAALYIEPKVRKVRYFWLPRLTSDLPLLYVKSGLLTKQDISEMLGISMVTIQCATNKTSKNHLRVEMVMGGSLLFKTADVLKWNSNRGDGLRPRNCQTREHAYKVMATASLVRRLRHHILKGDVTQQAVIQAMPHAPRGTDLDSVLEAVSAMKRSKVLDLLQNVGLLSSPN